jgi:multidrug efflux system outer membrane protein
LSQPDQGLPIGDLTDLLRRRPDVLRAQEAVAEAETASYTSLVALYKALGGG